MARVSVALCRNGPLYKEFHLNEPWDSPHNKQLIAKLPEIYKSRGVTEPGKTSLHVFTGENTPFGGPKPPRYEDFRDGTAHSLLFVFGGRETATEWTRPGGIAFAAGAGPEVLGTPPDKKGFPMAFGDGSVAFLPPNIPADLLSALVRSGDKQRIDRRALNLFDSEQRVRTAEDAQREAQERRPEENMQRISRALEGYLIVDAPFAHGLRLKANSGLSWRVHLLAELGETESIDIYNQIHLDEPWDSPHNIQFVEQMPAIYKTPGVARAGTTAFHVFAGPGTPLNDERPAEMSDFIDGRDNTVMMVMGGPESAVEWTRPGGLPLDAEDPFAKLGTPVDGGYLVTMFDQKHTVRLIPKDTPPDIVSLLIQHQDGRTAMLFDRLNHVVGGNSILPATLKTVAAENALTPYRHPMQKLTQIAHAMHACHDV